MAGKSHILIVDDEESIRDALSVVLKDHTVTLASNGEEALAILGDNDIDVLIQDIRMPGMDGLELLGKARELSPDTVVLVMTAFTAWETATQALRQGAYDYIKKPFDNADILNTVKRAISLKKNLKTMGEGPAWELVGHSEPIREIFSMVKRVAPTESTVLIQGESGAGKELIAHALHSHSLRHTAPFISVNCGAFTSTLLESELFGHVKGAFTGADKTKQGLVDVANGGTFFLDEVSEMPLELQVKLLRLLEEKEFIPVGSNKTTKVDVRFVCATNRNLQDEVKKGTFREDLFYRLNVIPLYLPPLRERGDDVVDIAQFFIDKYSKQMNSPIKSMNDDVKRAFCNYPWPGNVRELENTVQRALALADPSNSAITLDDLEEKIRHASPGPTASGEGLLTIPEEGINLADHLESLEKQFIIQALEQAKGNKTEAARLLGMKFRSICYKIDKLGITS